MRGLTALLVAVAVAVAGQGCARDGCSDVGGFDGIAVEIPRALFVSTGSLVVEICDAGDCVSESQPLAAVPEGAVGRGINVAFDDLGRRFEPGSLVVTIELSDARGNVLAMAQRDVQLTRTYPNGQACDGDGYLGGTVVLTPSDRL